MRTKRNVLRVIASFYDPMGSPISPIIVQMKILQQDICKASGSLISHIRDMNGIFRCKGTHCNSSLQETPKFPAWLPCDHHKST